MVLALCGASSAICVAGGPPMPFDPGMQGCMPPPPGLPPGLCGPAATEYSQVKEVIQPVPAQLRKVRVVAPYLAGIAWPRTPLPFFGNPQTFPNPLAAGRYEWLVPAVEVQKEHYWTYLDPCCKEIQVPRCVYVKANYVKCKPACGPMPMASGPIPMAPPPPMPMKVR